jgi:hypothetical protein
LVQAVRDAGARHAGVQHYLVIVLENRTVIQHSRAEGDLLRTRIAGLGDRLTFDLPGTRSRLPICSAISIAALPISGQERAKGPGGSPPRVKLGSMRPGPARGFRAGRVLFGHGARMIAARKKQ